MGNDNVAGYFEQEVDSIPFLLHCEKALVDTRHWLLNDDDVIDDMLVHGNGNVSFVPAARNGTNWLKRAMLVSL